MRVESDNLGGEKRKDAENNALLHEANDPKIGGLAK
jgi:hypothetical protein